MILLSCVQIIVLLTKAFMTEPKSDPVDSEMIPYPKRLHQCIDEVVFRSDTVKTEGKIATYFILLIMFIQTLAWLGSVRLLVYEYRKGLSEVWYSHKLFWLSEFVVWGI